MNIKQLTNALKYLDPKMSVMLKGVHGIGKTEWIKTLAKKWNMNLVIWHASHAADAGDITGLPYKVTTTFINPETGETEEHQVTKFAPPQWMLQDKPVLVLLDEINRGMQIALNAIMQFTNDGTYDSIKLPEGSRIFAAINPDEHGYSVGTLDPAQLSRFAVYEFNPSAEEWIDYMVEKYSGMNVVTRFIYKNPAYLDPYTCAELNHTTAGTDGEKLPDRRMWEKVWKTIKAGIDDGNIWESADGEELLGEILKGMVGTGAAIKFIDFIHHDREHLDANKVMSSKWNPKVGKELTELCEKDQASGIEFIKNCAMWCKAHETELEQLHADNMTQLVQSLTPDAKVAACSSILFQAVVDKAKWAVTLMKMSAELKEIVRTAKTIRNVKI